MDNIHSFFQELQNKEENIQTAKRNEEQAYIELVDAYRKVADTKEGRLILSKFANDEFAAMASLGFKGNSMDSFNLGRACQSYLTRKILKDVLPRELYLEIIYPAEKENNNVSG